MKKLLGLLLALLPELALAQTVRTYPSFTNSCTAPANPQFDDTWISSCSKLTQVWDGAQWIPQGFLDPTAHTWAGYGTQRAANVKDAPYYASGSTTTTTGTINSGSSSLSVASAAGWTVGMGIAVHNAGTGGNTELITTVTAISGTTFTLAANAAATATSQTVSHDDTHALATAYAANPAIYLPTGQYNITSTLSVAEPFKIFGDSKVLTQLVNRCATCDMIDIAGVTNGAPGAVKQGAVIADIGFIQDPNVSPSAGWALNLNGGAAGANLEGLTVRSIRIDYTFGGILTGGHALNDWFNDVYIKNVTHGINVNTPSPYGDFFWDNISMSEDSAASTDGVTIISADVAEWTNLKLNGGFAFTMQTANGQRISNMNSEVSSSCGIDFGTTGAATNNTITGGRIDDAATAPICNFTHTGNTENVISGMLTNTSFTGNPSFINAASSGVTTVTSCSGSSTSC